MVKYKEATCCKCLGELLVPEYDNSGDFYCNSCAWSKVGALGNPNASAGGLGT